LAIKTTILFNIWLLNRPKKLIFGYYKVFWYFCTPLVIPK